MSNADRLPVSLPTEPGYPQLLGVPMDVIDQLRALHLAVLDTGASLPDWQARHAVTLADAPPQADPAGLERLVAQVDAAAAASSDDFDHWLFLTELHRNLQLLQVPDPGRELRHLEATLPTLMAEQGWPLTERRLNALRALTGSTEPEAYEPGQRMIKALRVGTLEETTRWLRAAVAQNPGASVQDRLTRATLEVAQAKLELDRYDALKPRPDDRTA